MPVPMHVAGALNSEAQSVLDRESFVMVSQPVAHASSFHLGYAAVFRAHQPVYVTADAMLHAWHTSYDDILAYLETAALVPALNELLEEMQRNLPAKHDPDIAKFLGVASSLATGRPAAGDVATLVAAVEAAGGPGTVELFGASMDFDYSMMKPRGHYTRSVELTRYFRAMSWLGRLELRIAATGPDGTMRVNRRALSAVAQLRALLTPKAQRNWKAIDDTLAAFVGPPDSMSFPDYDAAMKRLGPASSDDDVVSAFANAEQKIGTQLAHPGQASVAFVFLGQRYVFDSHVFSNVTYGRLQMKRMMPSPLDVGVAVFGNTSARTLLAKEPEEYQRAIEAMVTERKKAGDALWKGSLYHSWLDAIRELSPVAERDASLPAPFRSEAWSRRMLDSQLASWAELRHDNILYAKQSVTAYALCDYPAGYVEPYPAFFGALESMATKGRTAIANLPFGNRARLIAYFERFAEIAGHLRAMATRERKNEELTSDDLDFLNHMVSVDGKSQGCTTIMTAEGWYADLFFDRDGALRHKPVVADVHTQPTDEAGNTVGKILHVGTGYPRVIAVKIAHDGGKHTRVYRGLVSSYAEVTKGDFHRLDDTEWQTSLHSAPPPPPEWLKNLVVE